MYSWSLILVAVVLVLGGLFSVLILVALSRSATGGDVDWQLDRLERKVDLILTNLGIGHDDHIPESVISLVRSGRGEQAVEEYRRLTGSRLVVARREIAFLQERIREKPAERLEEV
jgi:hypothetical protein